MKHKLQNTFAVGCLVQWYEIEVIGEYIESLVRAVEQVENPQNITLDFYLTLSQKLEKIDKSQADLTKISDRFFDLLKKSFDNTGVKWEFEIIHHWDLYTIADYRREFNQRYCEKVDVLFWGESDALVPHNTFQILDNLHISAKEVNKINKYVATFGICKMWDKTWEVIEHPEFTNKPFIENDYDNWWSLKYTMNIDEMNSFNEKVEELEVFMITGPDRLKFNGCGLVISSDLVKSGVTIPKSVFFVHEDTAFQEYMKRIMGDQCVQFVIKNILIVHNRNHPKKRMYVLGESGDTLNKQRRSNDWYVAANKMSEHNCYNLFKQSTVYGWEDVFEKKKEE